MLNALDETWQDEFTLAVSDWENGDPDALTLSVTRGEVDYACKEKDGVQKVCSGNFGDTGWLGINIISFTSSSREVQSSVAKMNEYYLRNADNDKRQYTVSLRRPTEIDGYLTIQYTTHTHTDALLRCVTK